MRTGAVRHAPGWEGSGHASGCQWMPAGEHKKGVEAQMSLPEVERFAIWRLRSQPWRVVSEVLKLNKPLAEQPGILVRLTVHYLHGLMSCCMRRAARAELQHGSLHWCCVRGRHLL